MARHIPINSLHLRVENKDPITLQSRGLGLNRNCFLNFQKWDITQGLNFEFECNTRFVIFAENVQKKYTVVQKKKNIRHLNTLKSIFLFSKCHKF